MKLFILGLITVFSAYSQQAELSTPKVDNGNPGC